MRIGLIGLGAAGRNHLAVLSRMPEVEVAGIADLNASYVADLQERFGVEHGTIDHRELLADPSIEAIAIAAADRAHYPLVLDCARAGKHVACEKPIATEVAHGREMVAAMKAAGKLLCVTFNNRAGQVTRRIREVVQSGVIGNLRMVRLIGLMAAPDNGLLRQRMGAQAAYQRVLGICNDGKNAIFDCGVHSFDYARFLTGSEFARVEAMGYNLRGFQHPDHAVALCAMENGVFVVIEKGFDYAFEAETYKEYVRYEVIGDEGSLAWDLDHQMLAVYARTTTFQEPLAQGGKEDVRETIYRGFVESVRAGELQPWLASGLDGVKAIEAAQAAIDSAHAKGIVCRDIGPCRNWFEDDAEVAATVT